MSISEIVSLLTPLVLLMLGTFAGAAWLANQRHQRRMEERRFLLEQQRLESERDRDREDQHQRAQSREEEAEFRRATLIPQDNADDSFYIYATTDDPVQALRMIAAAQALYAEHGFERPEIIEVSRGSVKVKFSTRIGNFFRDQRTRELFSELRIAAEEASIGRIVSENNERNSNAAANLIREMNAADGSARFVSPTMAVVKDFDEQGHVHYDVRIPTAGELVDLRAGSQQSAIHRGPGRQLSGTGGITPALESPADHDRSGER